METDQDTRVRMVALTNLRAMCKRQSQVCNRFWIDSVSKARVRVGYSNPNEYGSEAPMYAEFPCFRWPDDKDNPRVILSIVRVLRDSWQGEGWQAFTALLDCPKLWRGPEGSTWKTEEEIKKERGE